MGRDVHPARGVSGAAWHRPALRASWGAGLAGAALMACAQASAPAGMPTVPTSPRVIVSTLADWPSSAALAERLAALAGVPLRDPLAITPRRLSVTLECADSEACERALARLAADRSVISSVEPDRQRRLPMRPPRTESR